MIRQILTNIVANITEYHIISKLIFFRIIIPKIHEDKAFIPCKHVTIPNV